MSNLSDITNRITDEFVIKLIEQHGGKLHRNKQNELWFTTICHHGNSEKLCYFKDSKDFYCYTNCGKMSIFNFVMNIERCDFKQALLYLRRELGLPTKGIYGFSGVSEEEVMMEDIRKSIKKKNKRKLIQPPLLPVYDDKILHYFNPKVFYQGWIDENITISTMQQFNIRWYELEKWIIIPHYDAEGRLVGIRRRSLQEKDSKNKYTPLFMGKDEDYAHSLGMNLYGLHLHKQNILTSKKVVIVESEKSVMMSHSFFQNSCAVATCGFNVTNTQRDLILRLGVEEVILGFDKDFDPKAERTPEEQEEYMRYVNRIKTIGAKFSPFVKVSVLWDRFGLLDIKNSPYDKGKEVFEQLLNKRVFLE